MYEGLTERVTELSGSLPRDLGLLSGSRKGMGPASTTSIGPCVGSILAGSHAARAKLKQRTKRRSMHRYGLDQLTCIQSRGMVLRDVLRYLRITRVRPEESTVLNPRSDAVSCCGRRCPERPAFRAHEHKHQAPLPSHHCR
jgi:hypothetical protein